MHAVRAVLVMLAAALCAPLVQAQNIEGQVVASEFGEFKVPSVGNGFAFPPDSCQVSGGGKNFAAFSAGVPIKIVDPNPIYSEIVTPVAVFISSCAVSIAPVYAHTSFYLTSGTGGLQEAINNGQIHGTPNTIILNQEWYSLILPQSASTVIAGLAGSTGFGLVDVTTTPYTYYQWNGSQYVVITPPSAGIPATTALLAGSGNAGQAAATTVIPNGVTATTQATGDNTNKVATNAFVLANGGGPPTGAASGALGCTYPAPCANPAAVLVTNTYHAGTGGVTANSVVMNDASGNVIPFVDSSANYGLYMGIATSTASAGSNVVVANGSGQLVQCQFDGTPVVGDIVIGSGSTPGECHDTGTQTNIGAIAIRIPVVGWVQSVTGTVAVVRLAGLGANGTGNIVVDNTLSTQSFYGALAGPSMSAAQMNSVYDVDGFAAGASYYYGGIGVAQTAWSSSVDYDQCSAVSYSGQNYLSVVYRTTATPGFASNVWYPVPNANTPTALDCAFYTAAASIISGTGTITGTSQGSALQLGIGTYNTCIGLMEPTVTTPGWWTVSIKGSAIGPSRINQTCSISNPPLEQPPSTVNYALARFLWENFTVEANENAPAVVGLYGSQQSIVRNLDLYDAALGNDHYMEIGSSGNMGWVYELDMENVNLGANHGGCNGATFSTSVTSGVPTVTVTNGGSNCNVSWPPTPVLIQPGGNFCSGTNTLTYSSGAITGWTTTATGCNAATTASIFPGPNVSYGFKFTNMSDSHFIHSLICGGIGSVDCVYISNITSFNTFYKLHPISSMDGIQNNGRNDFFSTQLDGVYRRGFDFESGFGTLNIYGSQFEYQAGNPGSGDYYFGAISNPPTNAPYAINIYGDMCGSTATQTNYFHFSGAGAIIDGSSQGMPSTVHVHETNYCSQIGSSPVNAPDYVGLQYNWSPGAWGNVFQFNMNPTAGGTPAMTLTNPLTSTGANTGVYDWWWGNSTAATSSLNPKSGVMGWCSPYWNGSASTPFCIYSQLSYASGANPLGTLAFGISGTTPTGGIQLTWPGAMILPAGSTAVTQTTGDNTTKVATDAFVLANGSGVTWPANHDLVLSNTTNTPAGLAEVDGDCVLGAGGAWIAGTCAGLWSSLGNPTSNLSLNMAAYSSTFTYNSATGTSDLFKLTDTASNTGTGILAHFTTGSGSSETPWQADANGKGWKVNSSGALASTDTTDNGAVTLSPGSGGDSTCPPPTVGASFLCAKNNGISASINGAAYAPIAVNLVYTVSTLPAASSLAAGTQLTVSDATSFTTGTCTGGGSDYMIAVTNGTSWSCH